MLASCTTDSWLNQENEYFHANRLGGARQAKLDPKWQDGAFICIRDRSDEMLITTPSGVYKTRNCADTLRVGALGFRVPHDVEGYAVDPGIRRRERWQQMHFPQTWQSRFPRPHQSLRSWWRQCRWTVQRAGCTSGDPMSRNTRLQHEQSSM